MNKFTEFFKNMGKKIKAYFKPTDIQRDMMRYKKNGLCYALCFIALICNALGFCFVYSTQTNPQFSTGVDIIYNIIILLATFLVAEQIKVYNRKSSYFAGVVGILSIVHIFWYLMPIYMEDNIETWVFTADLILFIIAGACLIIVAVANYFRSTILHNYLVKLAKTDSAAALEIKEK